MVQNIQKQTPRINPDFDFSLLKDALSPLQIQLLQLVTGSTTVDTIIEGVNAGRKEAMAAFMQLVDAGYIIVGNAAAHPPEATPLQPETEEFWPDEIPEDSFADLFGDKEDFKPKKKPLDKKAAKRLEFESVLDDLIADAEEDERKTEFDDLLDEFLMEEEELEDDLPESAETQVAAPVQVEAPAKPAKVKKTRLPAIPGDRLAEFIWDIYEKKESKSIKFIYGPNKAMVIDFYEGEIAKIVPRPLDPHTFLGVLLAKHAGMEAHYIQESIELRKSKGVLQGEALISLGAIPPAHIHKMLRMQVIWRLIKLMRCDQIGFRVFPPRVTEPVDLPVTWKQALYAATWRCKDDDFLVRWGDQHGSCTIKKLDFESPKDFGLGIETFDLFKTTIIEDSDLAYYCTLKNIPKSVVYRAIYSYYRIGVVDIFDPDGKQIESKLKVSYLDAEMEEARPEGPAVSAAPDDDFFEFEMMLDPDSLDFRMPELTPEPEIVKPPEQKPVSQPEPEPEPKQEEKAVDLEKEKEKKRREREKQRAAAKAKRRKAKEKKLAKEAKEEFDFAMEHFNKGDWFLAHTYLTSAEAKEPENPIYIAYRAFSEFAQEKNPAMVNKTLAEIKRARDVFEDEEEETGVEFLFLAGMVHKLAGAKDKANIYFNKVLQEKEDHTAALREVRLYNMSKQKGPKSGILSMFGGKKKK